MGTLYKLLRAAVHSVLLFVLPWGIGAAVGVLFDVREVAETSGSFSGLFATFALPTAVLMLAGIGVKGARERRALAAEGRAGFGGFVEALDRHVRVLTGRGFGMLVASLLMVAIALSAKWAQFGVLAVIGIGLVYASGTVATLVSAFRVQAFDERVRRKGGRIERELSPALVEAGDPVEERFSLARLPVPPGFRLQIHEKLPARLGGETRFVADPKVSSAEATVSAPLPRTPRGEYRVGPATIWYEDVLGLTRVRVASHACAFLRVLPRLRPLLFDAKPRATAQSEGAMTVLSRLPTDDLFQLREYAPGDDRRRIHWKLSIKTGALQIRRPEAIPFSRRKFRLVLDTYLPPSFLEAGAPLLGDLLDLLVEGWIAIAQELVRRGEQVTLATAIAPPGGRPGLAGAGGVELVELACRRGEERRWRALGASVAWQSAMPLPDALAAQGPLGAGTAGIAVTGAASVPLAVAPGFTLVVAEGAGLIEPSPVDTRSRLERLFFFRYPVGAEDNRLDLGRLRAERRRENVRAPLERHLVQGVMAADAGVRAARGSLLYLRRQGMALALEARS